MQTLFTKVVGCFLTFSDGFELYHVLILGPTTEKRFTEPTEKLLIEPTFKKCFLQKTAN